MEPVRDPEGVEIERLLALDVIQGTRVLEIGCGDGRLVRRYAGAAAAVAGVDLDQERLADALAARPGGRSPSLFAQSAGEALPFPDGAFGCAIFGWSL